MKIRRIISLAAAMVLACAVLPAAAAEGVSLPVACGEFEYVLLPDGTAEVVTYTGMSLDIVIPPEMDGHPVTAVGGLSLHTAEQYRFNEPGTYLALDDVNLIARMRTYTFSSVDPEAYRAEMIEKYVPENVRSEMIRFLGRIYGWKQGWTVLNDYIWTGTDEKIPRDVEQHREARRESLREMIRSKQDELAYFQSVLDDPDTMDNKKTVFRNRSEKMQAEIAELEEALAKEDTVTYVLDSSVMEIVREQTGLSESLEDAPALIDAWRAAYEPLAESTDFPEGFNNGRQFMTADSGLGLMQADISTLNKIDGNARLISEYTVSEKPEYVRLEDIVHVFTVPDVRSVVIPEGVTRIDRNAFFRFEGLTDVSIPESITEIDSLTFQSLIHLNSLTVPAGVTSIGVNAFPRYTEDPDGNRKEFAVTVTAGSYAEQYCIENGYPYTYAAGGEEPAGE